MSQQFLEWAFLEGELIKFVDAKISIATHALHHGTAAFGGIRGYYRKEENFTGAVIFRLDDHITRFVNSAHYLEFELDPVELKSAIISLVKRNMTEKDFYFRPLVYTSGLEIAPHYHEVERNFLICGIELGDYLSSQGVSCTVSSWRRQSDASFPLRGKISAAYITTCLAKNEAIARGYDEALLMNESGKISEASSSNIFMVKDQCIITPSVDQDILEGITRNSVIKIARSLDYDIQERAVDRSELLTANEVFLTGTAAKLTAVNKIDQYKLASERPVFDRIKWEMDSILWNYEANKNNWLTLIEY